MKLATTILVGCVGALLALGMVILYSSRMGQKGGQFLVMQLMWFGIGLVICLAVAASDYNRLKKYSWILLGIAVVLLVATLIPATGISIKANGARRWLGLPRLSSIRFQPSELAKLALIMSIAYYCEHYQRQMRTFRRGLVIPGVLIAGVMGLIFLEPDWGATLLLGTVCSALLLISGVKWRYFIPTLLAGLGGLILLLMHNPVRWARMMAWFHPEEHKEDVGYQAHQAMVALGSGGWWGLGLGDGRQKLGFVPENQTDFILSVIGEELGLIATLGIVAAFIVLVLCGVYIAWNAREQYGFLLGAGLTSMIGLQAFINIGVVTSVLPNKGLPLPFISYGGSNLLLMMTSVGLLISIARHAHETSQFEEEILNGSPVASLPY